MPVLFSFGHTKLPNELTPTMALALLVLFFLGNGISLDWHWSNLDKFVTAKSFNAELQFSFSWSVGLLPSYKSAIKHQVNAPLKYKNH